MGKEIKPEQMDIPLEKKLGDHRKPRKNKQSCKPVRQISGDHRAHMLQNARYTVCRTCNLDCTVIAGTQNPDDICFMVIGRPDVT